MNDQKKKANLTIVLDNCCTNNQMVKIIQILEQFVGSKLRHSGDLLLVNGLFCVLFKNKNP
jgi:hypothetical protein